MPSRVFKSFLGGGADDYVFKPAMELRVDTKRAEKIEPPKDEIAEPTVPEPAGAPADAPPPEPTPETDPLGFAKIQAEAIIADAKREAEQYREQLRAEFDEQLEIAKRNAREEAFNRGYAEGMAQAMQEGREECERMALEQIKGIEGFLEAAARARDKMLDDSREELKDLAVAVAEKIIHVSLKNSSDIILRMVDAATDTHKRCEWAHVYVADCDVGGKAYTVPELTAALSHIADRVRVIPMPDEESGTCIVELPDVIYDASVSTQLENIREVLDGVVLEKD